MEVSLEQLQTSLQDVSSGVYNGRESDLFQALESIRPQLLKVLDFGQKSATERSALKDGPGIMRNGLLYKPNAAAAERIIFLSDHLDTSETFCASIMDRVVLQQPNLTPIAHVELATREYYAHRDAILGIWSLLLGMTVALKEGEVEAVSLIWRLAEKTKEFIREGEPSTVLSQILAQVDSGAARVEILKKKLVDATSQTNTATSLSDVVLEGELEKVQEQRRGLAGLLILLCETRELRATDMLQLLEWASKFPSNDDLRIHTTTAVLLLLSPDQLHTATIIENLSDKTLIAGLLSRFDKGTAWTSPETRAVSQLQVALFLVACRAKDPALCDEENATVDAIETLATEAMESDAFVNLNYLVLYARGRDSVLDAKAKVADAAEIATAESGSDLIEDGYRPTVYKAVESVIVGLLVSLPNVLKRLKHRQEDIAISNRKPQQSLFLGRAPEPLAVAPAAPLRTDIASLFRLIGTLYDALPAESAQKFWVLETGKTRQIDPINARLPSFLRWAAESRGEVMVPAVYDMLAGLAKGTTCSEHAYNFLSTGGVASNALASMQSSYGGAFSWSILFGSLGYYAESLPNPRTIQQYRQQGPLPEIRMEEATLLVSFLKLLRVVAQWSIPARLALADHPQYRAVPSMLQLATCRIPLELKGAIYQAVAAFCSPGGGAAGSALCRNTWLMLEQLQVLDTQNVPNGVGATHGIKFELMEIEITNKVYPCSTAFIQLMNSLIHTPKDLSLKQVLFGSHGGPTIPDGLGAPHRHLPLQPYISYVVDDVLFLAEDQFQTETERWMIKDLCLRFVEKSLASYDLESLPGALQGLPAVGPQTLRPWIIDPGFDILVRLLSDTRLRAIVNDFIAQGPSKLEKKVIKTVFFESCMRRVVRIVHRVLDMQSFFLDMLVPALQSFDFTTILSNFAPGQLIAFDRHLLFNHILVERIGLLVALPDQEMQLLAIRIISMLALSPHFTVMDQQASRMARRLNRLAVIIQGSDDSARINDGFASLLAADSAETLNMDDLELQIGAGAPPMDEGLDTPSLTHLIRLEIIDLLLKNIEKGRPAPNIAHLILGFDVATPSKNEMTIQDPSALDSTRSCFHVITEVLSEGIPSLDLTRRRREARLKRTPLYFKAPLLAEKCHQLLYQLCSHELTSKPVARYLRTREDYFARNLAALPIRAPAVPTESEGMASYADGVSIDSNCHSLTSFLRMRSWLLESIALELHLLTDERQFPRAGRLLDILYGNVDTNADPAGDDGMDDQFFAGGELQIQAFTPGQSLMRVLEIFQSFDLVWQDATVSQEEINLYFFASLDYSSCLRAAESGAEIIDRDALISLLSNLRQSRQDADTLSAEAQVQLSKEVRYLLESCVRENNRREIEHAKAMGFEAWRRVVNTSLSKCFDRLPVDGREGILFDLLQEVPPVIRRPSLGEASATLLSEVTVMLITKLREDRSQRILVQSLTEEDDPAATSLPEDRFHKLLTSLLECILTPGMPEVVRGNLYASIINHLQLVHTIANVKRRDSLIRDDHDEEPLFGASREVQPYSSLEIGCINIINSQSERLIPVLCRDAIDGSEVWKTVAFTLLDSLVQLSRIQRQHRILHLLARGGYLSNFCVGLKEADEELQATLNPEPGSLNSLYVHEAKMAFLIRIAQTRQGAERLLAARVLSVLAQCDFVDARPDGSQSFLDADTFLSPVVERWHQLLKPSLQLVISILATSGSSSGEAHKQAIEFVTGHRETLRGLLLESSRMPLSQLIELPLIISICSYVVPSIDRNDLTSRSSAYGPLHEVLMSLSAKTLYAGRWGAAVVPSDERELAESRSAPAAFQARILESTEDLQRAMFSYLVAASDASGSSLNPILNPGLIVPREGDPNPQLPGASPSVGDAIISLREIQNHLNQSLVEVNSYSVKLLNQDNTGMDELEEMAISALEGLERLEPHQRRALAFGQLQELMQQRIKDSTDYMNSLEMLLLLLWRHTDYYINAWTTSQPNTTNANQPSTTTPNAANDLGQTARPASTDAKSGWGMSLFSPFRRKEATPSPGIGTPLGVSTAVGSGPAGSRNLGRSVLTVSALGGRPGSSTKSSEEAQAEMFRADVAAVLEPVLDKLEGIQLPDDIPDLDFRVRGPYIQAFIRRLRGLINIEEEKDTEE